jgi:cell division protein FtsL
MSATKGFIAKLKSLLLSSRVLPFVLAFTMFGVLFVLFRMKGVEMDYKISALNKDIERVVFENKELKAKKAKLLSIRKLRALARKHGLYKPKQDQIIIIR